MTRKFLIACFLFNLIFIQDAFAQIIEDEVAIQSFQGQHLSKQVCKIELIQDEAELDFKGKNLKKVKYEQVFFEDEFVKNNANLKKYIKPAVHYKIIDENAGLVTVKISPVKRVSTQESLKVGSVISFKVLEDIYRKDKLFIKKDTPVLARVEMISSKAYFGEPDEIELGKLTTKDVFGNLVEIDGIIRKQGADRGKWVRPLWNVGVNIPYPCAPLILFYFVKGGNVCISPKQEFSFYYE